MIQIRHVPDDLHRTLKVRAGKAGMTLSDHLRRLRRAGGSAGRRPPDRGSEARASSGRPCARRRRQL